MSDARQILHSRCKEIRATQRYIASLERGDVSILVADRHGTSAFKRTEETLVLNSIKAAFIVMLYNLAEAVVVSTINEIYCRVKVENLGYNLVASEIRDFWLQRRIMRIRQSGPEKYMELVKEAIDSALSSDGLEHFDQEEIRRSYSGNVDARIIRDMAANFAVPLLLRRSTRNGEKLRWVKENRNHLGHGVYSFSEVGATQSANDLRETSIRVRRFLSDAVLAFDRYLNARGYAA